MLLAQQEEAKKAAEAEAAESAEDMGVEVGDDADLGDLEGEVCTLVRFSNFESAESRPVYILSYLWFRIMFLVPPA